MKKSEIQKIAKSKTITHCYIRKGAYYYRPAAQGYTEFASEAGVFTKEEALRHALKCDELILTPIKKEAHNTMILNEVKDLLSRII